MPIVPGFRFAGVAAGIKKAGTDRLDVGMLVADAPAAAAAVFTRNRVKAAPVLVSQARIKRGRCRGIVVNAGNANACTGERGLHDAEAMTRLAAEAIGGGARAEEMCVASTGVIGNLLPMDRLGAGIVKAAAELSASGFDRFAEAILTTDKGPKTAQAHVKIGRRPVIVAGCTKGAGMIAPNMATTLTFVTTDAQCAPAWLRRMLREEAETSFNSVTVDGDTSTNDSLFLLASGASGAPPVRADDADGKRLRAAVREVLRELAFKLVSDGEGATKLVTFAVSGAASVAAARAVARRIAHSPLVKTALHGADPNWGRILCAIGNAGVPIAPDKIEVDIGDVPIVRRGVGVMPPDVEAKAHAVMASTRYAVHVRLGQGKASAECSTCDLTAEYVSINADYRS
jgi:glutamate N-acetyltransferase/amino-acid N-acetyltransferase